MTDSDKTSSDSSQLQGDVLCIALSPTLDVSSETERVVPMRKTRTSQQQWAPGGGAVNVARVIQRLGGHPDLLYCSGGQVGKIFDECLARFNIPRVRVGIDGETRIAFMVAESSTNLEYRFVPESPSLDPQTLKSILETVENFQGRYIIASGSLPADTPVDTYVTMARFARRSNKRFILDTSGAALAATLKEGQVFLVKPSLGELEQFCGHSLDTDGVSKAAHELVTSGAAEYVAVSMGAQGAVIASSSGVRRLTTPEVSVRSAVGAGDSFVGGFVSSLVSGETVDEAFLMASAAGAAAVMTPGTELCRADDVESLRPRVRFE